MQISQKMQVIFRLSDTLPLTAFPAFAWGSQEGEISKLLSPSVYYGSCYAVEVILLLIYAALWALK